MLTINARNVNDAFSEATWKINVWGVEEDSRNGKCLVATEPVLTCYSKPLERMLWEPKRDANPFFHVMEAMWMLAGRNDVESVSKYARQIAEYSDDGVTLNGAYGYRWRNHFEHDQIDWVIKHLKAQPNSRRAVLGMWDPMEDPPAIDHGSSDVPCNTHAYFRVNQGRLNMTVCCRSNDIVWGCYGTNAVHMSYLMEYVACALGVMVGRYYQFSNNWHMYERHYWLLKTTTEIDWYSVGMYHMTPLTDPAGSSTLIDDLIAYFDGDPLDFRFIESPYLQKVIRPLVNAWSIHKEGDTKDAIQAVNFCTDQAIATACIAWLTRRIK